MDARQGFLAIDVLSGQQRRAHVLLMMLDGSGDDHRINVGGQELREARCSNGHTVPSCEASDASLVQIGECGHRRKRAAVVCREMRQKPPLGDAATAQDAEFQRRHDRSGSIDRMSRRFTERIKAA